MGKAEDFAIFSARDIGPMDGSIFVVAGPGGTGKSTLLASMSQEGPALLIPTLAREVNSWGYQARNIDTVKPITDPEWRPSMGLYEATAFNRFMDLMDQLMDDDHYKVILIDNGTRLADAAWHRALAAQGVGSAAEAQDKFRPYVQIADDLEQAIDAIIGLKEAKLPKIVGISWHVQPPKEDTTETVGDARTKVKVKKESADNRAEGTEYWGTVLPMIRGGFRRKLITLVDAMVYTDILFTEKTVGSGARVRMVDVPEYMIQVVSDREKLVKLPGPLPEVTHVPNDWSELKRLVLGDTTSKKGSK